MISAMYERFKISVFIIDNSITLALMRDDIHNSIRTIFRIYARVCNICPIIRHHDRPIRIIPYFGIRVNRIRIHLFVEVIKVRHILLSFYNLTVLRVFLRRTLHILCVKRIMFHLPDHIVHNIRLSGLVQHRYQMTNVLFRRCGAKI